MQPGAAGAIALLLAVMCSLPPGGRPADLVPRSTYESESVFGSLEDRVATGVRLNSQMRFGREQIGGLKRLKAKPEGREKYGTARSDILPRPTEVTSFLQEDSLDSLDQLELQRKKDVLSFWKMFEDVAPDWVKTHAKPNGDACYDNKDLFSCEKDGSFEKVALNGIDAVKRELPQGLFQLKSFETLQRLEISHSNVEVLPDLESLQITVLKLDSVPLRSFPTLPKTLKVISVKNVPLADIPESLWNVSKLRVLELENTTTNISFDNFYKFSKSLGSLKLTSVPINGPLPPELLAGFSYRRFNVVGCNVTSIPMQQPHGFNLKALRNLSLRDNFIAKLPRWLFRGARGLHIADLSRNKLRTIPSTLGRMKKCRILNLSKNRLLWLPDDIRAMARLRTLVATWNEIHSIPHFLLVKMRRLQKLDLSGNPVGRLPRGARLSRIKILGLSNTSFREIPADLKGVLSLSVLRFRENNITSVPEWLLDHKNFPKLKSVDLRGNPLPDPADMKGLLASEVRSGLLKVSSPRLERMTKEVQAFLGKWYGRDVIEKWIGDTVCTKSNVLGCDDGRVTKVYLNGRVRGKDIQGFFSIPGMEYVEEIHLQRNALEKLPFDIGKLKFLKALNVDGNKLTKIPEWLPESLQSLMLRGNRITSIDASIGRLQNLENLYLSRNHIVEVASEVTRLLKLKILDLHTNHIIRLPENVHEMTLHTIALAKNKLTKVPETFGLLPLVGYLDLSDNPELTELPETMGRLSNVKHLVAERCSLKKLPSTIGEMPLNALHLDHNLLSDLPRSLGRDSTMTRLSLSYNRFSTIPSEISRMVYLWKISFSHNAIVDIRDNMFENLVDLGDLDLSNNLIRKIPSSLMYAGIEGESPSFNFANNRISNLDAMFFTKIGLRQYESTAQASFDSTSHHGSYTLDLSNNVLYNIFDNFNSTLPQHSSIVLDEVAIGREGFNNRALSILTEDPNARLAWRDVEGSAGRRVRNGMDCSLVRPFVEGIQDSVSNLSIERCRCRANFYRFGRACVLCVDDAICKEEKVFCNEGFYLSSSEYGTAVCAKCPQGARCSKNQVFVEGGYWAPFSGSGTNEWVSVYKCQNRAVCLGGLHPAFNESLSASSGSVVSSSSSTSSDSLSCAEGNTGPLCQICIGGYYKDGSDGVCEKCPDIYSSVFYLISICAGGLTVTLVVVLLGSGKIKGGDAPELEGTSATLTMEAQSMNTEEGSMIGMAALKILVVFVQLVSSFPRVFSVEWDSIMLWMSDALGWINLDVFSASSVECIWEYFHGGDEVRDIAFDLRLSVDGVGYSFLESMLVTALAPIVACLVALSFPLIGKIVRSVVQPQGGIMPGVLWHIAISWCFLVFTIVYLPVSTAAFQFFDCRSFEDNIYYMRADLGVVCYNTKWYSYVPVAVGIITVYTLGLPIAIITSAFFPNSRVGMVLGRFNLIYKQKWRWWDATELLRRVVVTSVCLLYTDIPSVQVTVSVFMCFIYIVIHLACRPFQSIYLQWLQAFNLIMVYCTLSVGALQALSVPSKQVASVAVAVVCLDMVLVALTLCIVLLRALVVAQNLHRKLTSKSPTASHSV